MLKLKDMRGQLLQQPGFTVEVMWASLLYHLALIQDDYLIADFNHFGHVMRDVKEWYAGSLLCRFYFHEQARACLRVNRRQRFVEQDNRRVARQGASQSHSLTFTA